ncbi:Hypothetical protein NTJ_12476 [Nesidiocoris tenuis]|uniref:Uncharacterized protein n=1 Tax=Nesidiocoris tenuis TaxID=355587 RepID=A0ABN7B5J3_9HEMI|nr:Hypothetical protein NTJ_12476 [Nesidiocoris tenuis]
MVRTVDFLISGSYRMFAIDRALDVAGASDKVLRKRSWNRVRSGGPWFGMESWKGGAIGRSHRLSEDSYAYIPSYPNLTICSSFTANSVN